MRELPDEMRAHEPRNPNIPYARGSAEEAMSTTANDEQAKFLLLAEIMHPFLDRKGAAFGAVIMAVTLITLLALNAASQSQGEHPVFWVTLPAAVVMFCWDVSFGYLKREETRAIARLGPMGLETAQVQHAVSMAEGREKRAASGQEERIEVVDQDQREPTASNTCSTSASVSTSLHDSSGPIVISKADELRHDLSSVDTINKSHEKGESVQVYSISPASEAPPDAAAFGDTDEKASVSELELASPSPRGRARPTLVSLVSDAYRWLRISFPTVTAVVAHLPFMLVPFALSMFVLVQALVTKGWVPVFAHGWDHWVNKTGTIGSIGGMGFLSVVLCNVSSTFVTAGILVSRSMANIFGLYSLPAQISAVPSSSPELSRHGKKSTASTAYL
jgi:hypothetical protein